MKKALNLLLLPLMALGLTSCGNIKEATYEEWKSQYDTHAKETAPVYTKVGISSNVSKMKAESTDAVQLAILEGYLLENGITKLGESYNEPLYDRNLYLLTEVELLNHYTPEAANYEVETGDVTETSVITYGLRKEKIEKVEYNYTATTLKVTTKVENASADTSAEYVVEKVEVRNHYNHIVERKINVTGTGKRGGVAIALEGEISLTYNYIL